MEFNAPEQVWHSCRRKARLGGHLLVGERLEHTGVDVGSPDDGEVVGREGDCGRLADSRRCAGNNGDRLRVKDGVV